MMRSAAAMALLLCMSAPAFAQINVGSGGTGPGTQGSYGGNGGMSPAGVPAKQGDDNDAKPPEDKPIAPPPAIPGAQPDEDAAVAPADHVAAEMSPNEALFDAITRGDFAGAKDALNRGAQLDSKNVLGQTPTDASIDLDRNDITFLLLSMRTNSGSTPPSTLAAATPAPTRKAGGRKGVISASTQPRTTAQLSADRGAPNPSVGFIGF